MPELRFKILNHELVKTKSVNNTFLDFSRFFVFKSNLSPPLESVTLLVTVKEYNLSVYLMGILLNVRSSQPSFYHILRTTCHFSFHQQ